MTGRHSLRTVATAVERVPVFAWPEVSAIALFSGVLMLIRLGRYDFGGDELYFLAAGHRPAPSYADQGPLVPALAALADLVAPGSPVVLRLPVVLLTIVAVILSAALAREFGGGRLPQTLAALAYATTPAAVMQSAMLSTFAVDATLTAMVTWLLIRWVRTRRDVLLVLAGVVAAVDFQVKWLIPMVWAAFTVGVLIFGPRVMLRRPAWWLGSGVLVASAVPILLWQRDNGWPQLSMGAVVRDEQLATSGGLAAMPLQIILVTGPLGLLLLVGMWAGLRAERMRPYRLFIPVVACGLVGIVAGGLRPYFVLGAFPGLFAAGAVYLADGPGTARVKALFATLTAVATAIAIAAVVALPLPASQLDQPTDRYSQIDWRSKLYRSPGWDDLVTSVVDAYHRIPAAERDGVVIVTQNYWQASALEYFGRSHGLPAAYSPNRGYGFFAAPPDTATAVLYVGVDSPRTGLGTEFAAVAPVAWSNDPLGFPGVNRHVTVWFCQGPGTPWSQSWAAMRTLRMVDGTIR